MVAPLPEPRYRPVPNQPEEPEPADETWVERDLGPVVDGLVSGSLSGPAPSVGRRSDGARVFYAKRVNSIFGPSGGSKTFVAMVVAGQEMADGNHTVWSDFEDNEVGGVSRLLDLGVEPGRIKNQFHYFSPLEPFGIAAQARFLGLVAACRPTLVVIDSVGEAMAIDGTKPNDDDSVARWMRSFPRWIADLGPAVVCLDHTTKANDGSLFAAGSHRKRAAVNGLALQVDIVKEFGIGREGRSKLTCAKDRAGHFVRGSKVAELVMDASVIPYRVDLLAPEPTTDSTFRPTHLMEKVSRWLELNPDSSKREIEGGVHGKAEFIRKAIDALVAEGYVDHHKQGQATRHRLVRPFREDESSSEEAA